MHTLNRRTFLGLSASASLAALAHPLFASSSELANPFYAMDTSFHRQGLTPEQQLDLVKELGFAGVAWTDEPIDKLKADLAAIESRGLKMFTIYCGAKVTPAGELTLPANLKQVMQVLKGHDTIIWVHIGGQGPSFEKLQPTDPIVKTLRAISDDAAQNDLRVAIYPHLGEWTAHFADATRLAELVNHPRFGVTFNLCHALAVGDEAKIPELLERARRLLFTATICGADAGVTGGHWDKLIQPLGSGTFDVTGVLRKLHQIDFTGPIGFQGFGIKADARSILAPTMAAWKTMSAAAAG